ncbi:hypothetical protein T439DRAFT_308229 [Meredithblackwellia eburnea MCA 4105]
MVLRGRNDRDGYTQLPIALTTSANPSSAPVPRYGIGVTTGRRSRPCLIAAFLTTSILLLPFLIADPQKFILDPFGDDDLSGSWSTVFEKVHEGWRPLSLSAEEKASASEDEGDREQDTVSSILTADLLSTECQDAWVSKGVLCGEVLPILQSAQEVDVLYTWTNGTRDRLLRAWREALTPPRVYLGRGQEGGKANGRFMKGNRQVTKPGLNHFQDHDELRFSMRSLLTSFTDSSLRKIHLVTADLPVGVLPKDRQPIIHLQTLKKQNISGPVPPDSVLVGQIPQWLNLTAASTSSPTLAMVHHHSIFHTSTDPSVFDSTVLPTFNSLAIESRIPNIEGMSEFVLYMNDDVFINGQLSSADVGSPLLGPVFRIQRDLTVNALKPGSRTMGLDGEWPGLRHANWLLDQRFGKRDRGYLAHIAKAFSTPLLREMEEMWREELLSTSQSRFRGNKDEFQPSFLATHYIVERHREALLWSFFVARADRDGDGLLTVPERRRLLADLGAQSPTESVPVTIPRRSTTAEDIKLFNTSGLVRPLSSETAFDSRDGFAMASFLKGSPWPVQPTDSSAAPNAVACNLDIPGCLGSDFLSETKAFGTNSVFKRVAFEFPLCGDCAVLQLVGKSGPRGLSAFLPEVEVVNKDTKEEETYRRSETRSASSIKKVRPLGDCAKVFSEIDFVDPSTTRARRARAARLIHRYSYIIGSTDSRFIPMRDSGPLITALCSVNSKFAEFYHHPPSKDKAPTFLTLNDDIVSVRSSNMINEVLHQFFLDVWPIPSSFEKQE